MKVSFDDLIMLPTRRVTVQFNEMVSGLAAIKPVLGELTITASSTGMTVTGRVKTLLKLTCDSCLKPYFQSLTVDIDEKFVNTSRFDEGHVPRERELLKDDFVEPLPGDGMLDIDDVVYQAVTLATPTYAFCGQGCEGPPQREAGAGKAEKASPGGSEDSDRSEAPIDPRWKNLKSLFPKNDTERNS